MTVQTGINNTSSEWFKHIIDKKTLKNLSKKSDYDGLIIILTLIGRIFYGNKIR